MSLNQSFIYGLIDPRNGELRYIGKSDNPAIRYSGHYNPVALSKKTHKIHWLKNMLKDGVKAEMIIIEKTERWQEAEVFWIAYFKSIGCKLTNGTVGGETSTQSNYIVTQETRDKQRAKALGRTHTTATKDKLSVSKSKPVRVTTPTGEQFIVNHLSKWCKDNNFKYVTVNRSIVRKTKTYGGYRFERSW